MGEKEDSGRNAWCRQRQRVVTGITAQEGCWDRIYFLTALWETLTYWEDGGLAVTSDAMLWEPRVGRRLCHSPGDKEGGLGREQWQWHQRERWTNQRNISVAGEWGRMTRNVEGGARGGLRQCCLIQTHEPQKPPAWGSKDYSTLLGVLGCLIKYPSLFGCLL